MTEEKKGFTVIDTRRFVIEDPEKGVVVNNPEKTAPMAPENSQLTSKPEESAEQSPTLAAATTHLREASHQLKGAAINAINDATTKTSAAINDLSPKQKAGLAGAGLVAFGLGAAAIGYNMGDATTHPNTPDPSQDGKEANIKVVEAQKPPPPKGVTINQDGGIIMNPPPSTNNSPQEEAQPTNTEQKQKKEAEKQRQGEDYQIGASEITATLKPSGDYRLASAYASDEDRTRQSLMFLGPLQGNVAITCEKMEAYDLRRRCQRELVLSPEFFRGKTFEVGVKPIRWGEGEEYAGSNALFTVYDQDRANPPHTLELVGMGVPEKKPFSDDGKINWNTGLSAIRIVDHDGKTLHHIPLKEHNTQAGLQHVAAIFNAVAGKVNDMQIDGDQFKTPTSIDRFVTRVVDNATPDPKLLPRKKTSHAESAPRANSNVKEPAKNNVERYKKRWEQEGEKQR